MNSGMGKHTLRCSYVGIPRRNEENSRRLGDRGEERHSHDVARKTPDTEEYTGRDSTYGKLKNGQSWLIKIEASRTVYAERWP